MKNQMLRTVRLLLLMVLCCAVLAGNLLIPNTKAEAAAKNPSITKAMTIPVGKLSSKTCWNTGSIELGTAEKLTVKNKVQGATYSFSSSNTKVVTVSKDGGFLTGLKAGSATITCTQTYKSKKTTVGQCKVTVKNAALVNSEYEEAYPIGSGRFDLFYFYACIEPLFHIEYRNPDATYSLTSSSKDFTIKEVKCDASTAKDATTWDEYVNELKSYIGDRYFYGYQFTAKKAGTYTITVKETYQKKTRNLGSFKVVIKDTVLSETELDLLLGNYLSASSMLEYRKENTEYYCIIEGYDEENIANNVLLMEESEYDLNLYANKTGTAKVTFREGSKNGALIGTVSITVKEAPCQEIILEEDEITAYVDGYLDLSFELKPYDTTDKVTITSDNPKVLKVEYDEDYNSWSYTMLKVGTANLTIQCGNQSAIVKVTVEEW